MNKVLSAPLVARTPGTQTEPAQLMKMFAEIRTHGYAIDDEESIYVAQWNSGRTFPIKLVRV